MKLKDTRQQGRHCINQVRLIKFFKYIFIFFAVIIALIFTAIQLPKFDAVQHWLADFVSGKIESELNIPLSAGKIRIENLNEIMLENVVVLDAERDTILLAHKAAASIEPSALLKGKLYINTLAIAKPDIRLSRAVPGSPLNIQFILDNLNSDDKGKDTDLRINQLIVYDGKFRYDVLSEELQTEKIDLNHIEINDFACNVSLKHFNKKDLNLYIRSVSGSEKSGFALEKLRTRVIKHNDQTILSNLSLELPDSDIAADTIVLTNIGKPQSMAFDGELRCNRLTLKDFTPIFPEIPSYLPEFSFNISGHADSTIVNGDILVAATDGTVAVKGKTRITDPLDEKRRIEIIFDHISAKESVIGKAASLFDKAPQGLASKLGDTNINGRFFLSCDSVDGFANINSKNGSLNATLKSDSIGNYRLVAKGNSLHLGNILENADLGTCNIQGEANGNIREQGTLAEFDVEISELNFKEYTYAPISVSGVANRDDIKATINTEDANIDATLDLAYNKEKRKDKIKVVLTVDSIIPNKLNLYNKEGHNFAFNLDSEIELHTNGKSLTNVKLQNFCFNDGKETTTVKNIHLYDDNTEEKRSVTINSDILNADIIGYFDTKKLVDSYIHLLNSHIPALNLRENRTKTKNDYFYRVEILDSELFSKLFDLPLTINEKSTIRGACFDSNNTANIDIELNNVTAGKSIFRAINLKGTSDKEQLVVDANILKPLTSNTKVFDYKKDDNDLIIGLHSVIESDTISSIIDWSEILESDKNRGTLRLDAMLGRDERKNLCIEANIAPGSFTHDNSEWSITPGHIKGNSEKIVIENLQIYDNDQSLKIEGVAGKFIDDSLNVYLNRMDVATIMGLINFRILQFGGNATGSAHLTSLLHSPDVNGHFDIENFSIDDSHMGDGILNIGWMSYNKTITLDCDILNNGTKSKVGGFLSQAQDTIMLKIDANRLNLGFLNKKISSFVNIVEGTANGTAYVLGGWRSIDLGGTVAVNEGSKIRVNANNVTYTFLEDSVHLNAGVIEFRNIDLKDKTGNRGILDGKITHDHFSNWKCNLNVEADNMLVYDTHDFSSMTFYGSVYASGNASIISEGRGLELTARLRSEPNSSFVYNSSTASGASDNSFVTFTDSRKKGTTYTLSPGEGKNNTYDLVTSKLNLDFMVDVTDAFHVKVYTNLKTDDYIDFYGNGTINALYDEKNGFSMKGGLNLDRGTYKFTIQDIFPKEFNIVKGSTLSFDGDPFKAALNLKTKYLVPSASLSDLTTETSKKKTVKVNCVMDIGGTLESPALSFDLELPEGSGEEKELLASVASTTEQKNMQFIYLLGVGKFYTFDYNKTGSDSQSSTAVESLISNTLSGQLNQMLGQIINNDNWDISGNFSSSERGWNRMEVEGMLRGRLLNNRLLINGNFGYRENPIANSNFIGDFELQWLLTQKGNVNLKAYSKTNDRYFSKTNLTTQGAGILFKFDFDKWRWWKRKEEKQTE